MVALNLWLISSCAWALHCLHHRTYMKTRDAAMAKLLLSFAALCATMGEWDRGVEAKILHLTYTTSPNNNSLQAVGADSRVRHNDHAGIVGPSVVFYDRRRQCTIYWYCTRHSRNRWTKQRTSTRLGALREQHASVVNFFFSFFFVRSPNQNAAAKKSQSYKMSIKQ